MQQPLFSSGQGDVITRKTLELNSYNICLAGVTRIELASAVLETVALPLCYTPIIALFYYYINI